jgi:hypothetical protein
MFLRYNAACEQETRTVANDLSHDDTGDRLEQISYRISGDGRQVIFDFATSDRSKAPRPTPIRFFTGYEGLGLLIMTLHQAARAQIERLAKSGASEDLTKSLRSMIVTHVQSAAVGLSTEKTTVSLQVQTMEGHLASFAVDPTTARTLGQSLIDTAARTAPKSSLS